MINELQATLIGLNMMMVWFIIIVRMINKHCSDFNRWCKYG